jgi:UDP-glucose:(heptosyl)LPS alpha-1,3-glucosyltransferase
MTEDLALVFPEASRRGGVERIVWDLADHFIAKKRVSFVGRSAPDGMPNGVAFIQVPTRRLARGAAKAIAFRRDATRALRRVSTCLTISHGVVAPPGDVLWVHSVHRAWLGVRSTIPIAGIHVSARARYLMPRHALLLAMEREYFKRARPRAVVCTSQREVDDVANLYGVDASLTTVVPNWYDPRLFNYRRRATEGAEARARMAVTNDEIAVIFVANELHRKGFKQLITAFSRVDDDRLSLHVIGRAAPTAYRARIEELGLQRRIRYHGATQDVGAWLAGADLLVLPTQYEPFGLVIIEALAAGVPVITTRIAGAAEAVRHGETGLLQQDPYDVEELTSLFGQAASSDLHAWGERAAASVDHYRRDHVLKRVEALLSED